RRPHERARASLRPSACADAPDRRRPGRPKPERTARIGRLLRLALARRGLGAFDAATLGKPVIMTGWSAQLDYLAGASGTWPGAVPYRLVNAPVFPPHLPSFFPGQHWAQADLDAAAALMRRFHEDGDEMRAAARAIRTDILPLRRARRHS